MHIQYESYKDILDEKTGFGRKIVGQIIDYVTEQVTTYCQQRKEYYLNKYQVQLEINYDELRANQAIIDTLEDLKRLKEFHPVQHPNGLKCAAYLAYWWLQRQPLSFSIPDDQQEAFFKKATKEDIAKLVHANAFWLVSYVLGELFTSTKLPCYEEHPEFETQWDIAFDYIFYFFCYRVKSAKSIEVFLSTILLHPTWEVKEGVYFEE